MKKKIFLTLVISTLVLTSLTLIFSKALFGEKVVEVMEYIVGAGDFMPDCADANGDGKVDVLDVIALIREQGAPYLDTLELESERYSITFDKYTQNYTVALPAGRPVIPLVKGTSEGNEVKVDQAYIPDGGTEGQAKVTVSDGEGTRTYTVNFVRSEENGFVMQYDDRLYVSEVPELAGKTGIEYRSSDEELVAIDENGVVRAVGITDEPVTVYANYNGSTVWHKTVDRVEKARLNIFLVTGQSTAQGCYATGAWAAEEKDAKAAEQHALIPEIGTTGAVYGFDVFPRSENKQVYGLRYNLYDLNEHAKQGWEPALGKEFYDSCGEKVLFYQSAYTGAPIEAWLDPERHTEAGTYTSSKYNFYAKTKEYYPEMLSQLGDNFEIVRTCNIWYQGGTGMASVYDYASSNWINSGNAAFDASQLITDQQYYDRFMMINADMIEDFGVERNYIILNRVITGAASAESIALQRLTDLVPVKESQLALTQNGQNVILVSRVSEWSRMATSTDTETYGYGFIGEDNVHSTQIGHNEVGRTSGISIFQNIFGTYDLSSAYIDLLATNGRDRLGPSDTIEMQTGDVYRTGAIAEPIAASLVGTWSSSDEAVATVTKFGKVTAVGAGSARIIITFENGMSSYFNVSVTERPMRSGTDYLWDFNDLTSSLDKNDLTVSDYTIAQGASGNYTLHDGLMTQARSLSAKKHPDFIMEKPVELTSASDWYIEWRAKLTRSSVLIGQPTPDGASATIPGYIYLAYDVNFGTTDAPSYPFRFLTGKKTVSIQYGDYKSANLSMNTWRLSYSAATNQVTLFIEEDGAFTPIGSAACGEFDLRMDCLFGRFKGGTMGINGDVDYVRVHTDAEKGDPTVYLWNFANLKSFDGSNDLTVSDYCVEKGTDHNYTIKDGIYSVASGATSGNRPDFKLEKPITFDSTRNWTIEWRAKLGSSSVLFGCDTPAGEATIQQYIYLAYTAAFGGTANYSLKVSYANDSKVAAYLPYGDYKSYASQWNTWRLRYDCKTDKLTFELLLDGVYVEVNSVTLPEFSFTVDTVFGRFKDASTGFNGSCDYVKVILEEAD